MKPTELLDHEQRQSNKAYLELIPKQKGKRADIKYGDEDKFWEKVKDKIPKLQCDHR